MIALKVRKRDKYPDKTLERLLDALDYWGLAKKEKESGYWVWCENSQVFDSEKEYNLAFQHSRKLLPTLEFMSHFAFNSEDQLFLFTKEHLRSYPEIYKNLEKLEEVNTQKNKELIQKISQSIKDPHKRLEHFKFHPHQLIAYLVTWNPQDPEDLETRNNHLSALKPDFGKYFPIYREFAGGITLLKYMVEIGFTPLEGKCPSCPKIKIKKGDE